MLTSADFAVLSAVNETFKKTIILNGDKAWIEETAEEVPLKVLQVFLTMTVAKEISSTELGDVTYKLTPIAYQALDNPEVLNQITLALFS